MFNYSLILVSLISFIILISCDYNSNDLKNNGLIVKKCETYKYLLSNSDYSKNILHYKTEFYNNKEMLLTEITYSPIGEKHSVTIEENPYYLHKTIEELSLHNDSIFAIMYEIKKVMSSKKQSLLNKIDDIGKGLETVRKYHNDWIDVHRLRYWKSGDKYMIDFHLIVPYYKSVAESHETVDQVEKRIIESLGTKQVESLIHLDPCNPRCCYICNMPECGSRKEPNSKYYRWDAKKITSLPTYDIDDVKE